MIPGAVCLRFQVEKRVTLIGGNRSEKAALPAVIVAARSGLILSSGQSFCSRVTWYLYSAGHWQPSSENSATHSRGASLMMI